MAYFLLGFALLAGVLLISKWYATADVRTLLNALRWTAIGLLGLVTLVLLVSGRLGLALGAAAVLLPWAMRSLRSTGMGGYAAGGAGGGDRTSTIRTRFVHMSLDHASGRLDGEIIDGPQAGQRLNALSREALIGLLADYHRQDPQSAQLLEAYLDRMDPSWREAAADAGAEAGGGDAGPAAPGVLSRDDAYRILGLEPGASDDEIKAAHHRLIASLHPDRGGSSYLAAQVNRARDILLRAAAS